MTATFHALSRSGVCALSLLALPAASPAQGTSPAFGPGAQGKFSFAVRDGLALTAELRLPAGTIKGIVVVLHGGTGIGPLEREDEHDLLSQGLATVVVDSFGGRNFRPPQGTGAGATLRSSERVADAFAVLRALKGHPDLKESRAVLFGRSHGGSTVMIAATAWAKATFAPQGPSYVGYITLYPSCQTSYPEQLASNAAVRFHVGALDDLTPAAPCEAAVERMRAAGVDVSLTKYSDSHHAFDSLEPVRRFQDWVSFRSCDLALSSVMAPLPLAEMSRCATKGASIGSNPQAAVQFRKARAIEIDQLLRQ